MITAHMTNRKKTIFKLVFKLPNALTVYLKPDVDGAMNAFSLQGLNYGNMNRDSFFSTTSRPALRPT
jgi:hypothetical protein